MSLSLFSPNCARRSRGSRAMVNRHQGFFFRSSSPRLTPTGRQSGARLPARSGGGPRRGGRGGGGLLCGRDCGAAFRPGALVHHRGGSLCPEVSAGGAAPRSGDPCREGASGRCLPAWRKGCGMGGWLPLSVRRPVFRSRHQPWCDHFVPLEDRNAGAQAVRSVRSLSASWPLSPSRRLVGRSSASSTEAPLASLIRPGERKKVSGRPRPPLTMCSSGFGPPVLGKTISWIVF